MDITKVINQVLKEDSVAGGESSVFGSSVSNTATAFSGDTYATGDARNPAGLFSGVITRHGLKRKNRKKRRKKYKYKK